jgi:nicotinate-nucleotide adenylyltransferase
MKRIGIYSGAFDPVHAGHVAFALQAAKAARLDKIVFLPERRPRQKPGIEHFGHRVAMLKQAAKPYPNFSVMELEDMQFTVKRTLPKLQKAFPGDELVMLMGSDAVASLPEWPMAEQLLQNCELVVGMRSGQQFDDGATMISTWQQQPRALTIVESHAPDVSASNIRESLRKQQAAKGLLASVAQYARKHWLYVSLRG